MQNNQEVTHRNKEPRQSDNSQVQNNYKEMQNRFKGTWGDHRVKCGLFQSKQSQSYCKKTQDRYMETQINYKKTQIGCKKTQSSYKETHSGYKKTQRGNEETQFAPLQPTEESSAVLIGVTMDRLRLRHDPSHLDSTNICIFVLFYIWKHCEEGCKGSLCSFWILNVPPRCVLDRIRSPRRGCNLWPFSKVRL